MYVLKQSCCFRSALSFQVPAGRGHGQRPGAGAEAGHIGGQGVRGAGVLTIKGCPGGAGRCVRGCLSGAGLPGLA